MEREKDDQHVTHFQQELRLGKVYSHFNREIQRLDDKFDSLNIIVNVLKVSLEGIEKNTSNIAVLIEKNNENVNERFEKQDARISGNEKKLGEVSDKNKSVSMWLSFIGVISTPIIGGLFALAHYIFK